MSALKIVTGNANVQLSQAIAQRLDKTLVHCRVTRFADKEISVSIEENVRGSDVFVIQPISTPANDNLMELLIILDALKRASARRITSVIPYFGYARQDRKSSPRAPITAKLVADLIVCAGANRVLTVDLHAGQIQGFFNVPVDDIYARPVILEDIKAHYDTKDLCIVSPDIGGVVRARALAARLGVGLAIVDKRRERPGQSEVMNIIGSIEGYTCLFIDDIVDSAGTLCNAAEALIARGAKNVAAYVTHGVLSNQALARIVKTPFLEFCVTNTIRHDEDILKAHNIRTLSLAPLLAEAIERASLEKSISSLFE